MDIRINDAIPLLAQAVEISETDGDARLRMIANSRMADYLIGASRYKEAAVFLKMAEKTPHDDPAGRATYFMQKAALAAVFGEAAEAIEFFERAVSSAQKDPDLFHLIDVWSTYAFWAEQLGNIELSRSCRERALLVARKNHIIWPTTFLCLGYAGFLTRIGQYGVAYEYLLEALAYDAQGMRIKTMLANVGIPLALRMRDEVTLEKCAHMPAIECTFRSSEPPLIASVSGTFAEWYTACGRECDARRLLHDALKVLSGIEGENFRRFPIAVARFGEFTDIPAARRLLEPITRPRNDIVQAYLSLFDAYAAGRSGQITEAMSHAKNAVEHFKKLGYYGYVDLAHALLPKTAEVVLPGLEDRRPFADMFSVLTARERQVAELVLKGLTNRQIAGELAISPHTVDSHVNSIMNGLGIRSRHQLVDVLDKS